ncbi:hypothetical protein ABZV67_36315 [Streptomyces sp. NPDC005065]|uniref:hypothetical protein n=1 Tax=Streptomyces sp. NPDC005065 TaxID=3154461 RepID=UPI0033BC5932
MIFTSTSVGRSILASGTSCTFTERGPSYTRAFMGILSSCPTFPNVEGKNKIHE